MALLERIQQDLMAAMKAKDELRLATLRMIKAALKKHEVDTAKPLDAEAEVRVLSSLIKQRREAIEAYQKGGRPDLAAREQAELAIVESYLPQAPTEEELEAVIASAIQEVGATGPQHMGQVMKLCREKLAGKFVDGKQLAERVRARLS